MAGHCFNFSWIYLVSWYRECGLSLFSRGLFHSNLWYSWTLSVRQELLEG